VNDDDFVDCVMRQIATRPLPRRSVWRRLLATREVTVRVRPASWAVGAAAVALLALLVARPRHAAPTVANTSVAVTTVATQPDAPVLVRFTLAAPEARTVALAGDFNGWRPETTPLLRGADGVWYAHVPLARGNWSYAFVVDGRWVEDPFAESWRADGFGGKNAVLRVEAATPAGSWSARGG
jgi:hypothetical protein